MDDGTPSGVMCLTTPLGGDMEDFEDKRFCYKRINI